MVPFPFTFPLRVAAQIIVLLLISSATLLAKAPAKPSQGRVDFTAIGYPANDYTRTPEIGVWQSFHLSWQDNAVDEDGYQILYRYGTKGAFKQIASLRAGSSEFEFSAEAREAGTKMQFQIIAWKLNGKLMEQATLNLSFTIPQRLPSEIAPPTGLTARSPDLDPGPGILADDGLVELTWVNASDAALIHEIETLDLTDSSAEWRPLLRTAFGSPRVVISNQTTLTGSTSTNPRWPEFIPGRSYQFRIRTLNHRYMSNWGYSTTPHFIMPTLRAPANLKVRATSPETLELSWQDYSNYEAGFEIQYRFLSGGPDFLSLGAVGQNQTQAILTVQPNEPVEYQIRAYSYHITEVGGSASYAFSNFTTNAAEITPPAIPAPQNLVATASGFDHSIELQWESTGDKPYAYDLFVRPQGAVNFLFARALSEGVTKVQVDSYATEVDPNTGRPIGTNFAPLITGTTYEFVVRAVNGSESAFSAISNVATATAKPGFTMATLSPPAKVGQAFSYQVSTGAAPARLSWTATGIPGGLAFAESTGIISGTPTSSGISRITLTANFEGDLVAQVTLTLRILPSASSPILANALDDITLNLGTPWQLPLDEKFADADAEVAVRLATTKGNIDIQLHPSLAPETVRNFRAYVNAGAYDNMAFHRLVPGFVLQGGDLRAESAPSTFSSIQKLQLSPMNEAGISNTYGTIAAAKSGPRRSSFSSSGNTFYRNEAFGYLGDYNSATTNFFFNLTDNASNLDFQNGGFTAFGRVTTTGMAVVEAISALPPSGSYDITLDGSTTSVADLPMDAATAPATIDINKTVRINTAREIPALTYTLSGDVTGILNASIEQGRNLRLVGLAAGTRSLTITAQDLDGNTISDSFNITVDPAYQPPAITKQPQSQVVAQGAPARLSVTATGSSLRYQWWHDGEPIEGSTSAALEIGQMDSLDEGLYSVVIANDTAAITSNTASLKIRRPTDITGTLPDLIVRVGQPIELMAEVTGAPTPVFNWKRGGTVVKKQPGSRLFISAAKLSDAGLYRASATNSGGTDITTESKVFVIDKRRQELFVKPGGKIKLTAPMAGPMQGASYLWLKNGADTLGTDTRYRGRSLPVLEITQAEFGEHSGDYTCQITLPGSLGIHSTGVMHLAVAEKPILETLIGFYQLPQGYVGLSYQYQIPYKSGDDHRPQSFNVKGLPAGLQLNRETGSISGIPTNMGNFPIQITASNPSGTSNLVTGIIQIGPMAFAAVGTYVASIDAADELNQNMGGRLDLTITEDSSFSAHVRMGRETHKGAGKVELNTFNSNGSVTYRGAFSIPRKNKNPLSLVFTATSGSGQIYGIVHDGAQQVSIAGHRQFWHSSRNPNYFTGTANLGMSLDEADIGRERVPQGAGFIRATQSKGGTASFTGKLADGTSIIGSSIVGSYGEMILFQSLYDGRGALLSRIAPRLVFTETQASINRLSGVARWIKAAQPASSTRSYADGIPATFLNVLGNTYTAPGLNRIVMALPNEPNNAQLDFSRAELNTTSDSPNLVFRITTQNEANFTGLDNPAAVSIRIDPKTGLFLGKFELKDPGQPREVKFSGLIIPAVEASTEPTEPSQPVQGLGYFLLPGLTPSVTKSPIISGLVKLSPNVD